ncbi:hypothetical protein JNB63_15225 [Microbacterium trichothecenolyticum]|uniref:hypothetical protein n=1 Tax=Microbacterium trichothecenolyticum TaxID=69370 RepID=UPI001C6E424B|nr:hypothetical protein [Microbacterium trichothecenolyticum]MBW9121450.1 hypothetical protein [Microbacterium trichothecenolyticum]
MRDLDRFDEFTGRLKTGFAGVPGAHGLVVVGSAAAAERRDCWSDHDFLALIDAQAAASARESLDWLPEPERIVLLAREGALGFSVLYDDAHLLEFAVASVDELAGVSIDEAHLTFGDERARAFVTEGRERLKTITPIDATGEAGLVFVKLLVGYGRARRGERIVAGQFVRTWAVGHLIRTIRARIEPVTGVREDALEPARRFDAAYPEIAARLDAVLSQPVETAARGVAALAREVLESGWSAFPSRAADVAEAVLAQE